MLLIQLLAAVYGAERAVVVGWAVHSTVVLLVQGLREQPKWQANMAAVGVQLEELGVRSEEVLLLQVPILLFLGRQ